MGPLRAELAIYTGDGMMVHAPRRGDVRGRRLNERARARAMDGPGAERYNNEVVKPREASMAETPRDAEQVMANIRELNEQILEAGRSAGLEFLDAYERTLRTFADYQDKLADASQSDWLTQMMKAQANFTRDVVSAVSEVSRSALKK